MENRRVFWSAFCYIFRKRKSLSSFQWKPSIQFSTSSSSLRSNTRRLFWNTTSLIKLYQMGNCEYYRHCLARSRSYPLSLTTESCPFISSKPPPQNAKFKALQKLILSYFLNVIRFVSELSDAQMQQLAVSESAKLIPYVVSSRKAIRNYLKARCPSDPNIKDFVLIIYFSMRIDVLRALVFGGRCCPVICFVSHADFSRIPRRFYR